MTDTTPKPASFLQRIKALLSRFRTGNEVSLQAAAEKMCYRTTERL
ncbi:hypothetical protein [Actibacterium sp. XHP0104]|nr:hypothetical protein [Actibacterium sp. XHP0104]MCV2880746.1 hypothetical protein [Actibacterium sp. XHP0104]